MSTMMKAVLHTKYGSPDELQIQDVEKPTPKDDEVLIKIYATSVTSSDCNVRNFTFVPKLFLLPAKLFMFGVFKPRNDRLGIDLAGEIEAVGKDVTRFKVGDPVFGSPEPILGTHAEYICMPENGTIAIKPPNLSWEEAATVFLGGSTALYYMRNLGQVTQGQKVLIIGASGGVGTYAVQLAKYYGAEVTGVCSTTNLDMVKSIGADKVIDYTQEDFTKSSETYDVIFDVVGATSYSRCKHLLTSDGLFLVNLIELPDLIHILRTSMRGEQTGKKAKGGMASVNAEDMEYLKELVEAGKLKPVIDRCYPLEQIADAFKYVETGRKKGNVAITVVQDS